MTIHNIRPDQRSTVCRPNVLLPKMSPKRLPPKWLVAEMTILLQASSLSNRPIRIRINRTFVFVAHYTVHQIMTCHRKCRPNVCHSNGLWPKWLYTRSTILLQGNKSARTARIPTARLFTLLISTSNRATEAKYKLLLAKSPESVHKKFGADCSSIFWIIM